MNQVVDFINVNRDRYVEELKQYRGRVAMVDGAFDPLHRGHIEYFRAAAERLSAPLLCNVASDSYVRSCA